MTKDRVKIGIVYKELVKLIPIPAGLTGCNYKGESLYHKGYYEALADIEPPRTTSGAIMADISYREGYRQGERGFGNV